MTQDKPPTVTSSFAVPSSAGADLLYTAFKGSLSAVPVVGGTLAEFMQAFFASPIEKRRDAWMKEVAHALNHLIANGLTRDSLQANERFISAVQQASMIAQRTHVKEKLDALRNALLNIATNRSPDEALESIFLNMIDSFNEWHIRILHLFQSPSVPGDATELCHVLEHRYPELKGRARVYDVVWRDLSSRELVNVLSLHGSLQGTGISLLHKRTTELGDLFLQFVAAPS
jgi:hypothetical protein